MPAFDWKSLLDLPWLSWSIGGLIAFAGLILLYRALFSDRPRGRRRCPKCWYDMRGTPSLRCPECGHTPKNERRLHRTRRYWRWASLAAFCCLLGVSISLIPKVRRDGCLSLMPTTVLLLFHPLGPSWSNPKDPVLFELDRRNAALTLAPWQWDYLIRNKRFVSHRSRWPSSVPLIVESCYPPRWLSDGMLRVGTKEENLRILTLDDCTRRWIVAAAAPGASAAFVPARFDRTAEFWRKAIQQNPAVIAQYSSDWRETTWSGTLELPIRFSDRIEDAITPRGGLDDEIRRAVRIVICRAHSRQAGWSGISVSLLFDRSSNPILDEIALGFVGEFQMEGETTTITFDEPRSDDCIYDNPYIRAGSSVRSNTPAMATLQDSHNWTFNLRGDPELALRDWDKTAYWDGQITLTPDEVWIEGRDPVEDLYQPRISRGAAKD